MKKSILTVAILAMTTTGLMGATVSDNFDSYTAETTIPTEGQWIGWGGDAAMNGIVTAGPANSSPNSLAVTGGNGTDQVLELGYGEKTGSWLFRTMTYVPSANKDGQQYFNLMNTFDQANSTFHWSNVEVTWEMRTGQTYTDQVRLASKAEEAIPITYDEWVEVKAEIDLIADSVEVFYGGTSIGATTWAKDTQPVHGIDAFDIFPIGDIAETMYYDDISLTQTAIPEPSATVLLLLGGGLAMLRRRRS